MMRGPRCTGMYPERQPADLAADRAAPRTRDESRAAAFIGEISATRGIPDAGTGMYRPMRKPTSADTVNSTCAS